MELSTTTPWTAEQLAVDQLTWAAARCSHLLRVADRETPPPEQPRLLRQRLAPGMFCLAHQVVVLADSLRGAAALLAGREGEPCSAWVFNRGDEAALGEIDSSVAQALRRIAAAERDLKVLRGEPMPEQGTIVVARPGHQRHFKPTDFLWRYVLPNTYFHLSMVYALLRQAGLPIGKGDFEGLPVYTVSDGEEG